MHASKHTKSVSAQTSALPPQSSANSPSTSLTGAFARALARTDQTSQIDALRGGDRNGAKAAPLQQTGRPVAPVTRNELPRRGHR